MRPFAVAVLSAVACAAACSVFAPDSPATAVSESADIDTTTDAGTTTLATTLATSTSTVDTSSSTTAGSTSGPDSTFDPSSPSARYRLTIANTWSERTHPDLVPDLAHFSWLAGATHDGAFTLWSIGALASPGVVQMAETGVTDYLVDEITAAIDGGHVDAALSWQHWFCPPATATTECGPTSVEFEVALAHPQVSLASMLGPSPDLFIGVSSLPLLLDEQWIDHFDLELFPHDGGTRSDHDFTMNGALQEPPLPIALITSTDEHILGPGSLGTITFERVE